MTTHTYDPDYSYKSEAGYDAALDGDTTTSPLMARAWALMKEALSSGSLVAHRDLMGVGVAAGVAEITAKRLLTRALERGEVRARVVHRRGFNLHWAYTTAEGGPQTKADTVEWHTRRQAALLRAAANRDKASATAKAHAAELSVDD